MRIAGPDRRWIGYALAVLFTAGAALLRWALPDALAGAAYLAFYPAVVASAAFGGLGPGLVATAGSVLCVDLFFDQTPGWVDIRDPVVVGRLVIFMAGGFGASLIAGVKRATQARERRQARELAELAELTDLGYLLIRDEQDRITRWSEGCARLYGFTAEQAVGRVSHELLKTQFPQPLEEIQAALRRNGRWEGELVQRRADDRAVVVATLWVLRRGLDGAPPETLELNNDVTEQKRIQASLRESEQRLRAVFDNAALGIAEVDGQDRFIAANQRLCELLGYSYQELLGKSVHELTAPEDRPRSDALNTELHAGDRDRLDYDKRYLRRSGSRVWVHVTVSSIRDAAGRHLRSIGTVEDFSQRKAAEEALRESERKYRIVADHTYHWEFWLSPDGRFLYNSPSCREVTGYEAEAFIADPHLLDRIIHPDDQPTYHQHRGGATEGCATSEAEFRIVRRDGAVRWIGHACQPVYDTDGKYLGIRGSNRDITEKKRVEQELAEAKLSAERAKAAAERAKAAAEQANKAKDHFLAILSHELRTPLTPVLAAVSMLGENGQFDEDTRDCLEVIRRNVKLEARLIDDLLDVSRITRGKVELKRRPVDVRSILKRAVEVCRPDLEAQGLRFSLDLGKRPHLIYADPGRMQQVFWNLLKNAIKFSPPGGRIGIRERRDADHVLVAVSDNGIGIEPPVLSRIFDPFDQGDPATTRRFGGLGLGLAIGKALVELHGGTITASSPGRDQGATFTVRLPIHTPQPRSEPPARATRLARPAAHVPSGALRVLLVEDHHDTARILARLLKSVGHVVTVADDIASALAESERHEFDLLISDLGLPDGSGVDLVRELHARGKVFPAIAMTGYGQDEDLRRTREAGFVAHLTKPIELQQLEGAMASLFATNGD
jgi:two-component system CheB/CheR fusion protein